MPKSGLIFINGRVLGNAPRGETFFSEVSVRFSTSCPSSSVNHSARRNRTEPRREIFDETPINGEGFQAARGNRLVEDPKLADRGRRKMDDEPRLVRALARRDRARLGSNV